MGYSIKWPVMPSIGAVDLHSVGNQDYSTGFSIDYIGPRGKVTVYTKCWLSEGMRLVPMFDNYGTISQFTSKFHIDGDAHDAEEAVKLFLAEHAKDLVDHFIGAAKNELKLQQEACSQLSYTRGMLTSIGDPDFEIGDGVTKRQALDGELELRAARIDALKEVVEKASGYSRRDGVPADEFLASLAVDEAEAPEGAEVSSVKCARAVASEIWAAGSGREAVLIGLSHDHYGKKDFSEKVSFRRMEQDTEPFMHKDTSILATDIRDTDCLIMRSVPSISYIQGRLQRAFSTLEANPHVVIVSPSGNLLFKAKDLAVQLDIRSPRM